MGFGILLLSFFLSASPVGMLTPFFHVFGGAGMSFACLKLRGYDAKFRFAAHACATFALFNLVWSVFTVGAMSGNLDTHPLWNMGDIVLLIVSAIFLLIAMRSIARGVGRAEIASRCALALIITAAVPTLLVAVDFVRRFAVKSESTDALAVLKYVYLTLFALYILVNIFIAIQILSCYRWICEEGDEDMDGRATTDPLTRQIEKRRENKKK